MVAARFEFDEIMYSVIEEKDGSSVKQIMGKMCPIPGMKILPPRKEGDIFVVDVTVPDDALSDDSYVMTCSIKVETASKYGYNLKRDFKLV